MPSTRLTVVVIFGAALLLVPPNALFVASGTATVLAQGTGEAVVPFKISVPDAVLSDLKDRLARTRFPDEIEGSGWDYGTNLA